MPDSAMLPAIRAAIKANEIGAGDPYTLSFAGKGKSGASFGIFQNDTAANPDALEVLASVLRGGGLPQSQTQRIVGPLSKPCPTDPLTPADKAAADAALSSDAGRKAVDALDEKRMAIIGGYLDQAIRSSANPIDGEAQLGVCMWCNMTGAPTTLLSWLGGDAVDEKGGKVDPPGNPVSFDDLTRLLKNATYFVDNPRNWRHFSDSAAEGAKLLPAPPSAAALASIDAAAMANFGASTAPTGLVHAALTGTFPLMPLAIDKAQAFLAACQSAHPRVGYGLGKKSPSPNSIPGVDFTEIDCSGFVREAILRSTSPQAAFPDGSVVQHDWVVRNGYEVSTVAAAKLTDGQVRIAFLSPQHSPHGIGHVVLIYGARTLESHGGVGPDSRPWDGTGWQALTQVFRLA